MIYRIGADLILLTHFVFAAFAVVGGALAFYNPMWAWVHVPVVLWSSAVNLMSWTCPLTPAENALRRLAGQQGYTGDFVQHYIGRLVYPRGMPRQMELIAGVSILVGNAIIYAAVIAWGTRP